MAFTDTKMTPTEQIFHYNQSLKHISSIEVELSEPTTLQEDMRIADRLESLYSGSNTLVGFGTYTGCSDGQSAMQIA